MNWLGTLMALSLVACIETGVDETELASEDSAPITAGKTDAHGWLGAPTLHADTSLNDSASAGSRCPRPSTATGRSTRSRPEPTSASTCSAAIRSY